MDNSNGNEYFNGDEELVFKKEIPLKKARLLYPLTNVVFWLTASLIMAGVRLLLEMLMKGKPVSYGELMIPIVIGVIYYSVWAVKCLKSNKVYALLSGVKSKSKGKFLLGMIGCFNKLSFWLSWVVSTLSLSYVTGWGASGNFVWLIVMCFVFSFSDCIKDK